MKSYTEGRNLAGILTKNESVNNLSFIDQIANDDYRALCAMYDWPWLESLRTKLTVADTQYVELPYDCEKVRSVAVIISDTRYTPKNIPSQKLWDELNEIESSSDTPEYYYVFAGKVYLWPTPATSGNTINIVQKTKVIDLNVADYTTGTIVTATLGSEEIVGSATVWNASMVGKFISITNSAIANKGDGLWYEISGVTDATHLTLVKPYGGTSIATGSAVYTIGQMPLLPEGFQDLPWMWASGIYWQKENDSRGEKLLANHGNIGGGSTISTGKVAELEKTWTTSTSSLVIDSGDEREFLNPNLTISL